MTTSPSNWLSDIRLGARALAEYGQSLIQPSVRLGITGLSRAGKTVFITALVHGLVRGGRFPVFEAMAGGRIASARLAPQPDDTVPRFQYENHIKDLIEKRIWPDSTRQISELRILIDYQARNGTRRTLTLDIVDYPGEWLLDLPLLTTTYERWAEDSIQRSQESPRDKLSSHWRSHLDALDPNAPADETKAIEAARLFTAYLRACRDDNVAMSMLPPGRFLMPGDLDGSPALTFAPLKLTAESEAASGSLWAMMRHRYEAYKSQVVRPFFEDHFLRLDRQAVLLDALAAINAGPHALRDLQNAIGNILDCFQTGRRTLWSAMLRPRADRILFAATKADHVHQSDHETLEKILRRMTERAAAKAKFSGAAIDAVALASVRATREASIRNGGNAMPAIVGAPMDGNDDSEIAAFAGDVPENIDALFEDGAAPVAPLKFTRFRPPLVESIDGNPALPHIRLDRAMQFLIGDRLQ